MKPRRYMRHPSNIPVEYSLSKGSTGSPQLNNIGYGGLSFHSVKPLLPGQPLQISIPSVRSDIKIDAMVRWCEQNASGYQLGIEFLRSEDGFTMRMIEQVCHIENYRQKILEQEGRELSINAAAEEWIRQYAEDFPAG